MSPKGYLTQLTFLDRTEAGRNLANLLKSYQKQDVVIYALPRGGVVLGAEVAKALQAPLDLVIPRKIGHPYNPEYAICAVTETGPLVCNKAEVVEVDKKWLKQAIHTERQEAKRRQALYLAGRPMIPVEGKIAIIVDDGIATGLTIRAAIGDVKKRKPAKIVIAVPIIPKDTAELLKQEIDKVVALDTPEYFLGAVGAYYENFPQVTDQEVMKLMRGST